MDIDLKQLRELMRALKQFDVGELEIRAWRRAHLPAPPLRACGGPRGGGAPDRSARGGAATRHARRAARGREGRRRGGREHRLHHLALRRHLLPVAVARRVAFVDVGAAIKKGQALCIVEAMKLMNEIEAELDGTIVEILVENGQPVEYGQPLFKVEASGLSATAMFRRSSSPTAARSPCASSAPAGSSASRTVAVHSRRPTPTRCTCASPTRRSASARPPPRQSYLNIPAIIAAAEITGADAIHPGYGFLAENAEFAEICEQCGLDLHRPAARRSSGRWATRSRRARDGEEAGLPLCPGSERARQTPTRPSRWPNEIGYPVIIKASAGGGGRGMQHRPRRRGHAARALHRGQRRGGGRASRTPTSTSSGTSSSRGTSSCRSWPTARQRACTSASATARIQRRHQKLIEEAPTPR